MGGRHAGQGVHGTFGLGLLGITQTCVEKQDGHNHDGIEGEGFTPTGRGVGPLHHPGHQGYGRGGQEEVDQGVLELLEELAPGWHRRGAGQLVGAEPPQPPGGLVLIQPVGRIDIQGFADLIRLKHRGIIQSGIEIPRPGGRRLAGRGHRGGPIREGMPLSGRSSACYERLCLLGTAG